MRVIEYRVVNINGKVIVYCESLKDAIKCCHKFNKMFNHKGCKVVKVVQRGQNNENIENFYINFIYCFSTLVQYIIYGYTYK